MEVEAEVNKACVTSNAETILGVPCQVVRDAEWVNSVRMEDMFGWYPQDHRRKPVLPPRRQGRRQQPLDLRAEAEPACRRLMQRSM